MTTINEIITTLIKKAKENENINNVRFLKAYNKNFAENPVSGFIAIVNLESVAKSQSFVGGYFDNNNKGDIYFARLVIKVYSGSELSGEDLGDATIKIYEAIISADENNIIESSYIGPIAYDQNLGAIYREVNISLEFCLCGEE